MPVTKTISRRAAWMGSAATAAVAVMSAGLTSTALAQPAAETDLREVEEIVVSGSRIEREGFEASSPVTTVDLNDIKLSGTSNIENLLNTLPQVVPSSAGTSTSNNPGTGTALIDLRGFGANRNLVLVNGRRFTISGTDQRTDINTIPAALIERTEIVTGGSSAVYGSDAITGVVNFIMRDDFEGVEARAQTNFDSRTATPTHDFNLTAGGNFHDGRGNAVVSVNYLKRNALLEDQRDFSRLPLQDGVDENGNPALVEGGSGFVPNTRFTGIPTGAALEVNGRQDLAAALEAAGLGDLGGLGFLPSDDGMTARPFQAPQDLANSPISFLRIPQERWAITGFTHYDFHEKVTGYAEASFSNNKVDRELSPTPMNGPVLVNVDSSFLGQEMQNVLRAFDQQEGRVIGRQVDEGGTVIDPGEVCPYAAGPDPETCDSAQGPFQQTVTNGSFSRVTTPGDGLAALNTAARLDGLGPREFDDRRNAWRVALGFEGDLGSVSDEFLRDLTYDVYYSFARTENASRTIEAASRSRFAQSVLGVSGAPVGNIFGGNLNPEAAEFIGINATDLIDSQLQVAAGYLTGEVFDLPAGPVEASLGGEWRSASASFEPDEFLSSGDVAGFGERGGIGGNVTVRELFGEVRVPLLADLPFMENLTGNGAFRLSDYDLENVGTVWTYLGGFDWRVDPNLAIRAQFQRAIRAPTVGELFDDQNQGAQNATDPCSVSSAADDPVLRDLCIASGVPPELVGDDAVQPNPQVTTLTGGNPNLQEERSDTWTFGAVVTPEAVPGLRLSIDYVSIELEDAIDQLAGGAANALDLCFNVIQDLDSQVCQAIDRNPANGEITIPFFVSVFNQNIGAIKTEAIDFRADYRFDVDFGLLSRQSSFDVSFNGTWTDQWTLTPVQDLPDRPNRCVGSFGNTCGEPKPEFKQTTRLTWNTGMLSLSARYRFISSLTDDRILVPERRGGVGADPASLAMPGIDAQHYLDLSFSYDIQENFEFFGGVNNVTDNTPPVLGSSALQANTFPSTYDILGPQLFFGGVVRF